MNLSERLKSYVSQPISILCARYWYRGILAEVGDDHVVLSSPRAVEVTGSSQSDRPEREDPIPSDLIIRLDFVEQICQPTWVYHEMDPESIQKAKDAQVKAEADRKAGIKPVPKTETMARR